MLIENSKLYEGIVMKKFLQISAICAFAVSSVLTAGCGEAQRSATEAVEAATDEAAGSADKAGEAITDAANDAADKAKEATGSSSN